MLIFIVFSAWCMNERYEGFRHKMLASARSKRDKRQPSPLEICYIHAGSLAEAATVHNKNDGGSFMTI